MDKEQRKECLKRRLVLKKFRDPIIQRRIFTEICNLIDKQGLEDRKMEVLQRIKKS